MFPPGFTNRDGDPLPLIVQARTGGFNYATSDLACVIDRVERLGADLMLYVIGAPQQQHLEMVFAVAKMAGWMPEGVSAEHVAFGNVLGDDKKMLRSRSGESVKLVDLLSEAVDRASAAVEEKNPSLSEAERAAVAEMIGIGAVKYADLSPIEFAIMSSTGIACSPSTATHRRTFSTPTPFAPFSVEQPKKVCRQGRLQFGTC